MWCCSCCKFREDQPLDRTQGNLSVHDRVISRVEANAAEIIARNSANLDMLPTATTQSSSTVTSSEEEKPNHEGGKYQFRRVSASALANSPSEAPTDLSRIQVTSPRNEEEGKRDENPSASAVDPPRDGTGAIARNSASPGMSANATTESSNTVPFDEGNPIHEKGKYKSNYFSEDMVKEERARQNFGVILKKAPTPEAPTGLSRIQGASSRNKEVNGRAENLPASAGNPLRDGAGAIARNSANPAMLPRMERETPIMRSLTLTFHEADLS